MYSSFGGVRKYVELLIFMYKVTSIIRFDLLFGVGGRGGYYEKCYTVVSVPKSIYEWRLIHTWSLFCLERIYVSLYALTFLLKSYYFVFLCYVFCLFCFEFDVIFLEHLRPRNTNIFFSKYSRNLNISGIFWVCYTRSNFPVIFPKYKKHHFLTSIEI